MHIFRVCVSAISLSPATANVDVQTDTLIQHVIRERFTQCTIVTIAHRLHTILDYDHLLVMDRGHIAETGSPRELADKPGGVFANMLKDTV